MQALATCLAAAGEQPLFKNLLSQVKDSQTLDAQSLVSLLKLFQDANPELRAALVEREEESGETLQQTGREQDAASGKARVHSTGKTGLLKPCMLTGVQKVYVLAETPEHSYSSAAGLGGAGLSRCCPRGWIDGCTASASRAPLSRSAESSFLD